MSFGTTLKEFRQRRKLSLRELAGKLRVDHAYLSRLENGTVSPSEKTIRQIARLFRIPTEELSPAAGKLPDDVTSIFYEYPKEAALFLRERFAVYNTTVAPERKIWIAINIKTTLPIPGRLYPSHYSLLYYTKGKPRVFNRPRVPIPKCRHCGGDIKDYGGHRKWLNPAGLNLTDVWDDIPPVRHQKYKNRSANELSVKLLQRMLDISTGKGDLVLDPFGGGGTTYYASELVERRWIGCEIEDCKPIIDRLTSDLFTNGRLAVAAN